MRCLHPHCPMGTGTVAWTDVVDHPAMKVKTKNRAAMIAGLGVFGPLSRPPVLHVLPKMYRWQYDMIMFLCPCLFNQVNVRASARGIVHFCEMSLGKRIVSSNVNEAFKVQHPSLPPQFIFPPAQGGQNGGDIMEMLCSEVLANEGIPVMGPDADGWPKWNMPGHILLNEGKMRSLKAFGDILVPCGPTNLVISVKSEAAKERLLYSSNAIEGVGFGFFKHPNEFWTPSRMNLYKRMGFSAIYVPDGTHQKIVDYLAVEGTSEHAVNVNGTPLYRPHSEFGADMLRVVGKSSLLL